MIKKNKNLINIKRIDAFNNSPFGLWNTLEILNNASEILLKNYDYDEEGYEILKACLDNYNNIIDTNF